MYDYASDGWNGAEYQMHETETNDVVVSGTLLIGMMGTDDLCLLNTKCYGLRVTSGSFDTEISWSFGYFGGTIAGGAPFGPAEIWVAGDGSLATGTCPFTQIPTTSPSQIPTLLPTPTTEFAIAPDVLLLSATKPENAAGKAYLVNLNDEPLTGSIQLQNNTLLSSAACSIVPASFTADSGQLVPIDIVFSTTGVVPNVYELTFDVVARTTNSRPFNQTYRVALTINAKAIASKTKTTVLSSPTIGGEWNGIAIYPYDSDGYAITTDNGENYKVSLDSPAAVTSSCAVAWSDSCYLGECNVPEVAEAGDWTLAIALDDVVFSSSIVHMNCQEGYYEDPRTEMCTPCPRGATCPSGATLESMEIKEGFWRPGNPVAQLVCGGGGICV